MLFNTEIEMHQLGMRVLTVDLDAHANLTAVSMPDDILEVMYEPSADAFTVTDAFSPLVDGSGDLKRQRARRARGTRRQGAHSRKATPPAQTWRIQRHTAPNMFGLSLLSQPFRRTGQLIRGVMVNRRHTANKSPSIEEGYAWLKDQTGNALTRLQSLEASDTAEIFADYMYFKPIYTTFQQGVVQCLLSALDHLRFLAWSLESHEIPFPYAQASLIRTAITGGATAVWMVGGNMVERRSRALEFNFNNLRSHRKWMDTLATEPKNQQHSDEEKAVIDAQRDEIKRRLNWIVQQANTILAPTVPFTTSSYSSQLTSDTDIVQMAGNCVPALRGSAGWDSRVTLWHTWQLLSGYAHARPWSSLYGSKNIVKNATPSKTGAIEISLQGDPDKLLDYAFRSLRVVEAGIGGLERISS